MRGLYRSLGLYHEGNKLSTVIDMIPRGSTRCGRRLEARGATGAAATPGPPSLGFRLGVCACMVILEMLVLDFYSV